MDRSRFYAALRRRDSGVFGDSLFVLSAVENAKAEAVAAATAL